MAADDFEWTDEDFVPRDEDDPIRQLRHYIRRRMHEGVSEAVLEQELIEQGLDGEYALEMIRSVRTTGSEEPVDRGVEMWVRGIPAGFFRNPLFDKRQRMNRRREREEREAEAAAQLAAQEPVPAAPPAPSPLADLTQPPGVEDLSSLVRPRYRLHSPGGIARAALLGGPLAGCILLASNYRHMKRGVLAFLAILAGVAGAAGLCLAVWHWADVPARLDAFLYLTPLFLGQLVGSALLCWAAAWLLQGRVWRHHLIRGGKANPHAGLGFCLLLSLITFAVQLLITYPMTWDGTGGAIVFGPQEELYYTEGVRRADAARLGKKLQELGVLGQSKSARTLVLGREGDHYQLRLFLDLRPQVLPGFPPADEPRSPWQDPELVNYFSGLRRVLNDEVFPDSQLEILLCDPDDHPMKRISD